MKGLLVRMKISLPAGFYCVSDFPKLIMKAVTARTLPSPVATAHAIARVVYRMLKYQVEYDPLNANEYQRQYEAQQIKYLKKRAARFGFQLVPT
jgi:hypothetical protein